MYIRETYFFNFVSPLFLVVGSFFAVEMEFITAAILILLGVALLISFHGIRIDPENKKIQKFTRILWFRFGNWVPMKPVQYLTINRYNIRGSQSGYLTGADTGAGVYKSYKINMVFEGKNLYMTLMKGNRDKMIEEALKIGHIINCRVLDYSTYDKKWIL